MSYPTQILHKLINIIKPQKKIETNVPTSSNSTETPPQKIQYELGGPAIEPHQGGIGPIKL